MNPEDLDLACFLFVMGVTGGIYGFLGMIYPKGWQSPLYK